MTSPRLNPVQVAPKAIQAMIGLQNYVQNCGLEHSLVELVKIRASQINGCAYCLNMHTADARASGETEQRLYLLNAWEESTLYTPRERAALAWTDSLTLIAQSRASDADYEIASSQFTPEELVNLTTLIGVINVWNRISVGFRSVHPSETRQKAA